MKEFDKLVRQVRPLHPRHLGRMPLAYNWTVHRSERATDVAFESRSVSDVAATKKVEELATPWC